MDLSLSFSHPVSISSCFLARVVCHGEARIHRLAPELDSQCVAHRLPFKLPSFILHPYESILIGKALSSTAYTKPFLLSTMTLAVDQQINKFNLHPRAFIALPSILLVLTCVTVSLRMYVRTRMIRAFGLDYWLLLGAFVSTVSSISSPGRNS